MALQPQRPQGLVLQPAQPQSAYVHVPFCSHRCGYCNFTLVAGRDDLMTAYLEALEQELQSSLVEPRSVQTLFFGGGTPTHLPVPLLAKFLKLVTDWLIPNADAEVSCEANPLDCTDEKLRVLQDFGVRRLSLGGQSFSDRKLKVLERDHTGRQLSETIERAAKLLDNVSLDLIFAAPDETLAEWQRDVALARNAPIRHLSTYGLTIERGSAFFGRLLRKDISEIESDEQLAMYEWVIDELSANGWEHYEVSNFARPGFRCRHNEAYWLGEPWWAFGPGAASFLPASLSQNASITADANQNAAPAAMIRSVNHQSTTSYIRRVLKGESPVAESSELSLEDQVRERLVFGLRRLDGVSLAELEQRWGKNVESLFSPYLERYVEQEWIARQNDHLRLTRRGLVISDGLWPDLLGSNTET